MVMVCMGFSNTSSDCASGLAFLIQAQLLDLGPKTSTMAACPPPLCYSLWSVNNYRRPRGHSKLYFFVDTMPRQLNFLSSSKELLRVFAEQWRMAQQLAFHCYGHHRGNLLGEQNVTEAKAFFSSSGMWPLSCGLGKEKLTKFFLYVSFMP